MMPRGDKTDTTSAVNVEAVIRRYRAAEDDYLRTLLHEPHCEEYRKLTRHIFDNEKISKRFHKALGFCENDDAAFSMICAARDVLLKQPEAADRFALASRMADAYFEAFKKIGDLIKDLRVPLDLEQREPLTLKDIYSWIEQQQRSAKNPKQGAIRAADEVYSDALFELLEQAHLKCDEGFSYWAHQEQAAFDTGGKVSTVGASSTYTEGATASAIVRALDRVITPDFSAAKRVGRYELIADLASYVHPVSARQVEGYLSTRRLKRKQRRA